MENKYFQPPFCVNGNKLCITKFVGGQEKDVPLCNFTARIVEDITVTNGIENERFLGIIGEDENGNPLRKITIPIKSFSQLEWAQEQWNMNCVINAGYGNRDNLRQAIQSTAKYAEAKTIYGTTGWWETKSGWEFCMPGGKNEVKLPEKTKGFSFRTDCDKETTLKRIIFQVLKDFRICLPLKWLQVLQVSITKLLNAIVRKASSKLTKSAENGV